MTLGHGMELVTKVSIFVFLIGVDVLNGSTFACRTKIRVSS